MSTVEVVTTHSENSCWAKCENCCCWKGWRLSALNPRNWDVTAQKVAQWSAVVLTVCIICLIVSGLMVQYPQAAGAFFTIFGVITAISLITMIVAIVKYCKQKTVKTEIIRIDTTIEVRPERTKTLEKKPTLAEIIRKNSVAETPEEQ